jgi:phasin family protein
MATRKTTRKTATKKTASTASTENFADFTKFADVNMPTPEAFQEGIEKMTESFGDIGEISKANAEAAIEAAQISAKGMENVSQEAAAYSKEMFDKSVEAAKALTTAKSPQEFIESQTEFTRSVIESQMAQFAKMTELMTGVTKQAAEPLAQRYTAMVDKAQSFRG